MAIKVDSVGGAIHQSSIWKVTQNGNGSGRRCVLGGSHITQPTL